MATRTVVTPPTPSGPLDPVARAAAQSALLAEQAAIILVQVAGGPSYMSRRDVSAARAPRANVVCNGGYSEQDTPSQQMVHAVISLYNDAACTSLRQRATFDRSMGVDTNTVSGTIVSFTAGAATVNQGIDVLWFASGGGYVNRMSTDSIPSPSPSGPDTLLGHTTLFCTFFAPKCALAAVTDGPAFETGVGLSTETFSPRSVSAGTSVTVPFTGSFSLGNVGSMTITQQPFQPPVLGGGATVAPFTGSLTITPGTNGPVAFSLTLDTQSRFGSASTHAAATFSSGTTSVTVSGGTSVIVNLNGDGTISYPDGTTGKVLDFRIAS